MHSRPRANEILSHDLKLSAVQRGKNGAQASVFPSLFQRVGDCHGVSTRSNSNMRRLWQPVSAALQQWDLRVHSQSVLTAGFVAGGCWKLKTRPPGAGRHLPGVGQVHVLETQLVFESASSYPNPVSVRHDSDSSSGIDARRTYGRQWPPNSVGHPAPVYQRFIDLRLCVQHSYTKRVPCANHDDKRDNV